MTLGPKDAAARRLVRLPDGRVGRLVYAPHPQGQGPASWRRPDGRRMGRGRGGRLAKVLVGGRHVRGPIEALEPADG